MFSFFKRKKNPAHDKSPLNKTVRVVGRGGLQQDLEGIYESENFKKAQRNAHLIIYGREPADEVGTKSNDDPSNT